MERMILVTRPSTALRNLWLSKFLQSKGLPQAEGSIAEWMTTTTPEAIDAFFRYQRKRCNEMVAATAAKCGIKVAAIRLDIEAPDTANAN